MEVATEVEFINQGAIWERDVIPNCFCSSCIMLQSVVFWASHNIHTMTYVLLLKSIFHDHCAFLYNGANSLFEMA